jgi:hypothetical protein
VTTQTDAPDGPTDSMPSASVATGSPSGPRSWWDGFRRRCPRGPAMLLLIVLVFTLNGITTHKVSQVSQIDEQYWIDQLVRGSKLEVTQSGDRMTDEAVYELCLRGGAGVGQVATRPGSTKAAQRTKVEPQPCVYGRIDAEKLGVWKGVDAAGHTPFYFLVTGPIARALRATPIDLPPDDSIVTWARLLGSVWLLIGWYLVLRVGDLLGVRRRWLTVALVFLTATQALLHASTIVNPDQTAVPSGAAVLLAALAWEKRGKGIVWVALAALVGAAMDPTNAIAILAVLIYFALRIGADRTGNGDDLSRPWTDYLKLAAVMAVAVLVASRGWDWFSEQFITTAQNTSVDLSKSPTSVAYDLRGQGLSFWQLFGGDIIFSMFPPFTDIAPPMQRVDELYKLTSRIAEILAIGAMIAVVLRDKIRDRIGAVAFTTVIALLVSPTVLVIYNYVVGGTFDRPIWRYGLCLLPFLAIVLATAMRTRLSKVVFVGATVALYGSAIFVVIR